MAKVKAFLVESSAMFQLLGYIRRLENMELHHQPKLATKEKLNRKKIMWIKPNNEWMNQWGISIKGCPNNNKEKKKYVQGKFKESI